MSKPLVEVYAFKDCNPCGRSDAAHKKNGCTMCVDAREVINRVNGEIPFKFKEIDICTNEDLFRRFKEDIPTIFINGKKAFKFKVNEAEFKKQVRRELIKAGIRRLNVKKNDNYL